MENLVYSLNATMPVFLIMVLGYCLGRAGLLKRKGCAMLDDLVFKVTLPIMLFQDMAAIDLRTEFDAGYVAFCAVATTAAFLAIWGLARRLLKDKSLVAEFTQCAYRSSAAILGMAFIQNMYGTTGMAPLMMLGSVPLFNVYAVTVLCLEGPGAAGEKAGAAIRKTLRGIVTNPIIDGILLGVLASALGLHQLPPILHKAGSSLAALTSPLALLSIGATFEGRKAIARLKPSLAAAAIKLVVLAALLLPVAAWLGFREQKLIALLVMLGSPATPTCYIMAKNMGHEGVLSSSVIALTTVLSSVTLTVWIFALRSFGLV